MSSHGPSVDFHRAQRRNRSWVSSLASGTFLFTACACLVVFSARADQTAAKDRLAASRAERPAWIARSDTNALILLQSISRFAPEPAEYFGAAGLDDKTLDLGPLIVERSRKALQDARAELVRRAATEQDPLVRQDLDILIDSADKLIEENAARDRLLLPYFNVSKTVFQGLRSLLDDQTAAERRPAALVRLRRYAGMEPGSEPLTELAKARTREKLSRRELLGPSRDEIERDLGNNRRYIEGVSELLQKYQFTGWEKPYETLEQQLAEYDTFVRAEVLPRAREDFRLPPDLYALALRKSGIDMPVAELTARASQAFAEIRSEMQTLAPLVAKDKNFGSSDYRDVIRELKKDQLSGDTILEHYERRIGDLEEIIRTHRIATLPRRAMRIRIATAAETAVVPAPAMRPPRLIGNTGEMGEFLLPLRFPGGKNDKQFDDFTFAAASWTLTAHEGRPGHEMQYAATLEHGVSLARSLFAFNNTNGEGWALYSEAECKPYEPLDGQLVALQNRLLRAARAFLDPGLQSGRVTREEAYRLLRQDVCLSDAMASQEVERYTFRIPGQAPSYFCGYARLLEIRVEAERALGPSFDRLAFNDFILSQGLLPLSMLRKAVQDEFVPKQKAIADRKSGGD